MKEIIIVKRLETILYSGGILDVPLKEKSLSEKSISVFGDEDPCVIHMSYVVKELVNYILDLFEKNKTNLLYVKDYLDQLSFLDFDDLATITIEIEGNSKWKFI